jgi:prophage regulatory protein
MLRIEAVVAMICLSRSMIYYKLNPKSPYYDSTFPKPLKLGLRNNAWRLGDLEQWIASKAAHSQEQCQ